MTFGCKMSHMAEHVSTMMLCTVDTPTQNLADSVLNESPVAKKLKYINNYSNLYAFVDQFKSNLYWDPPASPATAIRNLLCMPHIWFENRLFTLYTLASRLCTSLLTFIPTCHMTSKAHRHILDVQSEFFMQQNAQKMDSRNYQDREAEYKDAAGVFAQCDKLLSASSEMMDLNRVAYKA